MTGLPIPSREIRLRSRPDGLPGPENFALADASAATPGPGEVQVRNLWMSVDPYMRGRMTMRKSYVPPFELDAPLQGGAIGEVVASDAEAFAPGDLVQSMMGWREAFTAPADALHKLPTLDLPPEAYLGVAGMPGLTAFVGLEKIVRLRAGDVAFVSAASGAVGAVACQLAKIRGATVIGSAGGPEKCAYLEEIGVDRVIDYKSAPDLAAALAKAAPDGIDVYFDNVGGTHLEAALECARPHARFALCGMISRYNAQDAKGPANIALAVMRSLRLEGFIVSDHLELMPGFVADMAAWIAAGQVRWRQSVDQGIENAPAAFIRLFTGDHIGKMLVSL